MKLNNKKLFGYLKEKLELTREGSVIVKDMEKIEKELMALTKKEEEITNKVNPEALLKEDNELRAQCDVLVKKINDIGQKVFDAKLAAIPKAMSDKHRALIKEKEELQKELNKKALKIQKIKDRVRPIVAKLVAPHLKEYEEVEQVNIIGNQDEVTVTIVNRLDAFKKSYKK
jgi:septation ring formation regulator EzrA